MDLFTVAKIPMYCEGITHRMEKRRGGHEVKVVDLALKLEPLSAQLATALNQDEYGFVKRTLFKMASGDPVIDLRAVEFRPPSDRQKLMCFASPDTEVASIAFDQVKVTKIRARSSKDATGWTLYVHVSFGPVDKIELAYVNDFYTGQRFITWEEAEPSLDFTDDEGDEDEHEPGDVIDGRSRPAPMFDDDAPAADASADEDAAREAEEPADAARPITRRGSKKTKKIDHDQVRSEQKAEGAKRAKKTPARKRR